MPGLLWRRSCWEFGAILAHPSSYDHAVSQSRWNTCQYTVLIRFVVQAMTHWQASTCREMHACKMCVARVFTWWMAPALKTFAFAPLVLKLLDSRSQTIVQIMRFLKNSLIRTLSVRITFGGKNQTDCAPDVLIKWNVFSVILPDTQDTNV